MPQTTAQPAKTLTMLVTAHVYEAWHVPTGRKREVLVWAEQDKEDARELACKLFKAAADDVLVKYLCDRRVER